MEDNKTLLTNADVTEGWIDDVVAYDYAKYNQMTTDNYAQIETNLSEYEGMTFTDVQAGEGLKLYHNSQPILAEFTGDHFFILYNDEGQDLVTVNLSDGDIVYGEHYAPDEAAQMFWDSIGKVKVNEVNEQLTGELHQTLNVSAPPGIADDMPESYTQTSHPYDPTSLTEDFIWGGGNDGRGSKVEKLPSKYDNYDDAMKVID